jgi:inorganic pyrophosphatase
MANYRSDIVIETPAGSRIKYAWDPDANRFRASKVLPLGLSFPFDFGFFPGTKAADGDPLDALVVADAPLAVGAIVECRLLGVFRVATSEKASSKLIENDRLVAVPVDSIRGARWRELPDLGGELVREIGDFFESYIQREGRRFESRGRAGARAAYATLERSRT